MELPKLLTDNWQFFVILGAIAAVGIYINVKKYMSNKKEKKEQLQKEFEAQQISLPPKKELPAELKDTSSQSTLELLHEKHKRITHSIEVINSEVATLEKRREELRNERKKVAGEYNSLRAIYDKEF